MMDPDLGRYPVVWAAAGLPTAVFPVPPGTLRILANATVAPIAEERPGRRPRRAPTGDDRPTSPHRARERRTAQRDRHLSRRTARSMALGRQRPGRRGLRPVRGRRPTRRPRGRGSRTTRSPVSRGTPPRRAAWGVDRAVRLDHQRRAARRSIWDSAGLLVVSYGFHTFGLRGRHRRGRLGASLGDADRRAARITTARPRRRPGRARDLRHRGRRDRSPGASRIPTWSSGAELVGGRLVLTGYAGQLNALDPATGRSAN